MTKNIHYSLIDKKKNSKLTFTHEELLEEVMNKECDVVVDNNDYSNEYLSMQIDYKENYLKKDLERIAEYYSIPLKNNRKKKKKEELIDNIIIFEMNSENFELVNKRKTMWFYLEEIMNDNYLSKFIILD